MPRGSPRPEPTCRLALDADHASVGGLDDHVDLGPVAIAEVVQAHRVLPETGSPTRTHSHYDVYI